MNAVSAGPASTALDFGALYRRLDQAEAALARRAEPAGEERRRVLAARARALAVARTRERVECVEVVAFQIGGERYAVRVAEVDRVTGMRSLHPLAGAPPFVLGAVVVRTRILPVLDLRALLGVAERGLSDLAYVVVVGAPADAFGLAVESVEGRLELARSSLGPPPQGPFLAMTPDPLVLLDLARLGETG